MRTLFLFMVLLGTSLGHAQVSRNDVQRNNTYVSNITEHRPVTLSSTPTSQTTLIPDGISRAVGLHDLFGAEEAPFNNDGLSWPPLPRYWWQEGYSDYFEARVGIGLPPGTPVVNLNRTFSFKYEVNVTFHVLGTLKFVNRETNEPLTFADDLLPTDFDRLFTRDYVTTQEWFNVSTRNPMVGMCQYEIALYHGEATEGGVSFVLSAIAAGGRVNYTRMAVYSRMFNIQARGPNDEYSSAWYLDHECTDRFQRFVKPFVDDALAFKAQQYNARFHPNNSCDRRISPVSGQTARDCQAWHDGVGIFNFRKPETTVGRCEMQSNGESHCVLKSKEGEKCTLYYTDGLDTLIYGLQYARNNQRPPRRPMSSIERDPRFQATSGVREYPCDVGLTCTMDNYDTGIATCKRLTQRDRQ
jgi:hypothetical protein